MRNVQIVIANPAGNITAFVLTPVEQKDYKLIGKAILEQTELGIEQVGFIKSFGPNPRMEMCGLEFCGNAGRSFGLLCALENKVQGHGFVEISESGCNDKLLVEVNTLESMASVSMPLPKAVIALKNTDIPELDEATLVDLDGIMHIVLRAGSIDASLEVFSRIRNYIMAKYNPPAMGVMFVRRDLSIVPIVYVRDVDSTYEEGSCGSGTTACAIAWSQNCEDGHRTFLVKQPAGEIIANVETINEKVAKITIGGPVEFSAPQIISLDF